MANLIEVKNGLMINPAHIVTIEQIIVLNGSAVRIKIITGENINLMGKEGVDFWNYLHQPGRDFMYGMVG